MTLQIWFTNKSLFYIALFSWPSIWSFTLNRYNLYTDNCCRYLLLVTLHFVKTFTVDLLLGFFTHKHGKVLKTFAYVFTYDSRPCLSVDVFYFDTLESIIALYSKLTLDMYAQHVTPPFLLARRGILAGN